MEYLLGLLLIPTIVGIFPRIGTNGSPVISNSTISNLDSSLSSDSSDSNFVDNTFKCPLPRNSRRFNGDSNSLTRIIKLDEMTGRKVKIQFFYPNPQKPIRRLVRNSAEDFSGETTTNNVDATTITSVGITESSSEIEHITTSNISGELGRTGIAIVYDKMKPEREDIDVMCQWEFQAGNSSKYLLLTFNKMSAPYSDECKDAYVSMQKDDGYESRWCGNRRQGNGRPLALFSHTSATITVFRRKSAAESPPTGFSVTVESVDNRATTNQTRSLFRVLLRKMPN